MTMQDRIVAVLNKADCKCVWPRRRSVDRLWVDDGKIPQTGIHLAWAIWRLKRRGIVLAEWDRGYKQTMIGLVE